MITAIVTFLSEAFYRPSAIAFGAAALWGILSVLLSPCHLGAIPLIVGYVNGGARAGRKRAFFLSFLFALGLLLMLALVGLITSMAGRLMGDVGFGATIAAAVFLIAAGIWLMEIPLISKLGISFNIQPKRRGPLGALLLGLVYGVVLGPCSFAFLAPMLALVFSAGRGEASYGTALMLFYAAGHTLTIIAAGTFGDLVGEFLHKKGNGKGSLWFKRILGGVVVFAGVSQII